MRGPTLPFAPTKTCGPISINIRDKLVLLSLKLIFSLLSRTLSVLSFFFFFFTFLVFLFILFFLFFFFFYKFGYMVHIAPCVHLLFGSMSTPKQFISFQFNLFLNELSSSYFMTSNIFVKISSLESLATYHPENRKNILTVSEFNKTFLGH